MPGISREVVATSSRQGADRRNQKDEQKSSGRRCFDALLEDKDNPLAPVLFQQAKFGTFWAAPAVALGRCDPGLKGLCSLNR